MIGLVRLITMQESNVKVKYLLIVNIFVVFFILLILLFYIVTQLNVVVTSITNELCRISYNQESFTIIDVFNIIINYYLKI